MPMLAALTFAAIQMTTECTGCHTTSRDVPPSRLEVGLGHWAESNCVGCHHEMNEVAREGVLLGRKEARYWTLPLSEERRAGIVSQPLSFTSAPEDVALTVGPFLRIDSARLLDFLRRPVDVRRAPDEHDRMMAFPELSWGDIPDVVRVVSERSKLASTGVCEMPRRTPVAAGQWPSEESSTSPTSPRDLWDTRCKPCHESASSLSGRPPEYLALFTPDWIYAYANSLAERPGSTERTMPKIPISHEASEALYKYFGERREQKAKEVDARVSSLDTTEVEKRTAGRRLTGNENSFIWSQLLREGKCVHCHGANGHRANQKFAGTPWALAKYAREHGGMAIWRRLEVRSLEAELGMTAAAPGMPMASDPLSRDLRDLIYVWAREGCPTPSGRQECGSARTIAKKP